MHEVLQQQDVSIREISHVFDNCQYYKRLTGEPQLVKLIAAKPCILVTIETLPPFLTL
jgi:hypothetical protein